MKVRTCLYGLEDYLDETLRTLDAEQVKAVRIVMTFVESQVGWKSMLEKYPDDQLIEAYFRCGQEKEINILRALNKEPVEV